VSARRWERRRLAFLRAALVPATGPEASLATGRILEAVVDKVTTFGGVLEGLGPIGLVAVFGLDAAGDVADRAGYAAMAILKAMERSQREEGADVGVRLGAHVATALISVGGGGVTLDMDERHDLWPLLDELVERTPLNTILVTESSAPFLRRRFELTARPAGARHADARADRPRAHRSGTRRAPGGVRRPALRARAAARAARHRPARSGPRRRSRR
jgi:hypothetical protein